MTSGHSCGAGSTSRSRGGRADRRSDAGHYTESDSSGDIHKFTTGLAQAAQRLGAQLRYNQQVVHLSAGDDGVDVTVLQDDSADTTRYDAVVICAAAASRDLAAQVGDSVNVYPVKGYSVTVDLDDAASRAAAPNVSLVDDTVKLVCSRLGEDRLRVAGTAEFHGHNRDIRADRIAPLTEWVQQNFPEVSTRAITPWAGLRPMMPDLMHASVLARRRACFTTPAMAIWAGLCRLPRRTWWPAPSTPLGRRCDNAPPAP